MCSCKFSSGESLPSGYQDNFPFESIGGKSRRVDEGVYVVMISIAIRRFAVRVLREDIFVATHFEQFYYYFGLERSSGQEEWRKAQIADLNHFRMLYY